MTQYRVTDPGINTARIVTADSAREARRMIVAEMGWKSYEAYILGAKGLGGADRTLCARRLKALVRKTTK